MLIKELDKNKQKVFRVVLIFTMFGGSVFALINIYRELILLAVIEVVAVLLSLLLFLHLNKTKSVEKFKLLALIYITCFFSIMMFFFSKEGVSITIFTWVLIIPMISYLLLGVRQGFILTAIFYSIATVLFFGGYTMHPVMNDLVSYANMIICALLFWAVSHSYEHASKTAKRKLRRLAISDHLTGLFNRTTMQELFDHEVHQAKANEEIVSLVLLDLDSFKGINDQYGHEVGDQVLKKFALILRQAMTQKGVAFRIGGEEFAIVFSAQSDLIILSVAENIRRATEKININEAAAGMKISVSAGVATSMADSAVLSQMMTVADRRMYIGKKKGRNVVIHKG